MDYILKNIGNHDDPNPLDQLNSTPLHIAANTGNMRIFNMISSKVEDWSPQDYKGYTPLHYAGIQNNYAIFKAIYERIQDKNPKSMQGLTVAHVSALSDNLRILKYLFKKVSLESFQEQVETVWPLLSSHSKVFPFLQRVCGNDAGGCEHYKTRSRKARKRCNKGKRGSAKRAKKLAK